MVESLTVTRSRMPSLLKSPETIETLPVSPEVISDAVKVTAAAHRGERSKAVSRAARQAKGFSTRAAPARAPIKVTNTRHIRLPRGHNGCVGGRAGWKERRTVQEGPEIPRPPFVAGPHKGKSAAENQTH